MEHGARVAGDQRKLTARFAGIAELVDETSHWGGIGREVVTRGDVEEAIARRIGRSNLIEERIDELIADGTIIVAVDGERVGHVNGLSVVESATMRSAVRRGSPRPPRRGAATC